jgi:peptidoglycan/LPS O-acetylase OafA/YrhL
MGSIIELSHFAVMVVAVVGLYPALFLALVPRPSALKDAQSGAVAPVWHHGRYPVFDVVKGVAILAVVLIHVTFLFPVEWVAFSQVVLDLINNLLRFAIPFFLAASGALLRPVRYKIAELGRFYGSKVTRIIVPYVLVVGVMGWWQNAALTEIGWLALTGDMSTPFYFMSVLIQLYILFPFVQHVATRWAFVLFSLGVSVISGMVPFLAYAGEVPLFLPYLFFFVWGIYLRDALGTGAIPDQRWLWVGVIGLFVMVHALVGVERMYNLRFFFGPAALLLLYWWYTRRACSETLSRVLTYIGSISLWVFLFHFPILQLIRDTLLPHISPQPFVVFLVFAVGGVSLSIGAAMVAAYFYRVAGLLVRRCYERVMARV